jgi:hypothetical protein
MALALVEGAWVWLGLAVCIGLWAVVLVFARGSVLSASALMRWLLRAWLPRFVVLSAWAVAGWHVFCQRP